MSTVFENWVFLDNHTFYVCFENNSQTSVSGSLIKTLRNFSFLRPLVVLLLLLLLLLSPPHPPPPPPPALFSACTLFIVAVPPSSGSRYLYSLCFRSIYC